jgi:hypothetical protein
LAEPASRLSERWQVYWTVWRDEDNVKAQALAA